MEHSRLTIEYRHTTINLVGDGVEEAALNEVLKVIALLEDGVQSLGRSLGLRSGTLAGGEDFRSLQ